MIRGLIIFLATIALAACEEPRGRSAADLTVLTVSGYIAGSNRDGRDDFYDPLFTHRQIDFPAAYAFTYGELQTFPAFELTVSYDVWEGRTVTVEGPRLARILEYVGEEGDIVRLQAVDGYTYDIELDAITPEFILALRADGAPLGLGGRGPVWLVMPPEQSPAGPGDEAPLVWGIYSIEVLRDR